MRKKILIPFIIMLFINSSIFCSEIKKEPVKWVYIPHYAKLSVNEIAAINDYDVICFTGVFLTGNGEIRYNENSLISRIIKSGRDSNKIIYPLISFENTASGKKILNSKTLMEKAAANITGFTRNQSFPGIHLDFEYIDSSYADKLAIFIKTINDNCGELKLTMALYPLVDFNSPYAGFHDIELLAPHIDEAVIMCYDMHRPDTKSGPVTDITWIEKNIIHLLKFLPSRKIILGIPAYGYLWSDDSSARAVSAKHGAVLKKKHGYRRDDSGCAYLEYSIKGKTVRGYISDKEMRNKMIEAVTRYTLGGYAVWRAGFEE